MTEFKILQLVEFNDRWSTKISEYKEDNLADIFDKFFSLFVIYNRIYNVVGFINKKPKTRDKYAATNCISHYFKADANRIMRELSVEKNQFIDIIQHEKFYIDTYYGKGQPKEDQKLLDELNSNNEQTQLLSILKILYFLRCNLFHGEKGFNENQKEILIPAISCLTVLNNALMEKLTHNL